jgi:sulfur-carrier protein
MVRLLFFARLRDELGTAGEELSLPDGVGTVAELRAILRARGAAWERFLAPNKSVRIAVNQVMASAATAIRDGDEIAFFPPVTGG